jgi:hypothetical protein
MQTSRVFFPPLVVSLVSFALSSQADDRVPNAPQPSGSAEAPNVIPIADGAAPANGTAPAPGVPGEEASAKTAPTVEVEIQLAETNRQSQIQEELRKYGHRRRPGSVFFSMGGGLQNYWIPVEFAYHGSVKADSHDRTASGTPISISAGLSRAKIFQLVPEVGYQLTGKLALSLQARFQWAPQFDSVAWIHPAGASPPPTYALALFLRAQYALLTAESFEFFGSGVAGGGLVGGRTFLGYVPRSCAPTPTGVCLAGTQHSDTVSGGPVAVGLGLGITYHVVRFFAVWAELRGVSSFGPTMLLDEFNLGVTFAFPVAPGARR